MAAVMAMATRLPTIETVSAASMFWWLVGSGLLVLLAML